MTEEEEVDTFSWVDADGPRHAFPGIDGMLPCCHRTIYEIPTGDLITDEQEEVTCRGLHGDQR